MVAAIVAAAIAIVSAVVAVLRHQRNAAREDAARQRAAREESERQRDDAVDRARRSESAREVTEEIHAVPTTGDPVADIRAVDERVRSMAHEGAHGPRAVRDD